jgi:geranylgeranyl pyrophosphate synthase
MGQYGYNIGLAFQIIDDVLDLTADTAQLGKTAGIDLAQGRGYAAAHKGNGVPQNGVAVVDEDQKPADPMVTIKQKLLRGDAILEAKVQARQLAELAIASLDALPESEAKDELVDLAYVVVDRDH